MVVHCPLFEVSTKVGLAQTAPLPVFASLEKDFRKTPTMLHAMSHHAKHKAPNEFRALPQADVSRCSKPIS